MATAQWPEARRSPAHAGNELLRSLFGLRPLLLLLKNTGGLDLCTFGASRDSEADTEAGTYPGPLSVMGLGAGLMLLGQSTVPGKRRGVYGVLGTGVTALNAGYGAACWAWRWLPRKITLIRRSLSHATDAGVSVTRLGRFLRQLLAARLASPRELQEFLDARFSDLAEINQDLQSTIRAAQAGRRLDGDAERAEHSDGGDAARSDAARSDAARSDAGSDAARSDAARSDAGRGARVPRYTIHPLFQRSVGSVDSLNSAVPPKTGVDLSKAPPHIQVPLSRGMTGAHQRIRFQIRLAGETKAVTFCVDVGEREKMSQILQRLRESSSLRLEGLSLATTDGDILPDNESLAEMHINLEDSDTYVLWLIPASRGEKTEAPPAPRPARPARPAQQTRLTRQSRSIDSLRHSRGGFAR